MLARTVSLSSTVSWLTTPISARSERRPSRVSGTPSIRICPLVGSWNRGSRSASVVFPAPEGPTSATTLPLRQAEGDVAQDQIAVTIPERDPVEDHLPLESRNLIPGTVHLGGRLIEKVEDPLRAGQGHRHRGRERGDGLERRGELQRGHQEDDDGLAAPAAPPGPTSPGLVPAQMIRMTRNPENTSVTGTGERGKSLGADHPLPVALGLAT